MTKLPNHQAKTLRLVLIPKTGQEVKIRAFKELVARNGLQISDILFEKVDEFLREHNWPPGNSQTLMSVFTEPKLVMQKCGREGCGLPAIGKAWAKNGWQGFLCRSHYEQSRDARLLMKWREVK